MLLIQVKRAAAPRQYDDEMAKPVPPTKSMLAAIGRVAGESAAVEEAFRELLCYLIDSPYGRVISAGESITSVCATCLKVAQYNRKITQEQLDRIIALVKAVNILSPMRNFLVHARWEKGSEPGRHYGERSSRPSPKKEGLGMNEVLAWDVSDANILADQFKDLRKHVEDFIEGSFEQKVYVIWRRSDLEKYEKAMMGLFDNAGIQWRHEEAAPEDGGTKSAL